MSATTVRLLQEAGRIVGGEAALASRLGIKESFLELFLNDVRELPDPLLLKAVDIILDDRKQRSPSVNEFAAQVRER